jgi:hypothetical protein
MLLNMRFSISDFVRFRGNVIVDICVMLSLNIHNIHNNINNLTWCQLDLPSVKQVSAGEPFTFTPKYSISHNLRKRKAVA